MEVNEIVRLILSALLFILGVIFHESIKELIKRLFSNQTKQQINAFFVLILLLAALSPSVGIFIPENTPEDDQQEVIVPGEKSDLELYIEAGKTVVEITKEAIINKRRNDSIRRATRARMWVYKIGVPKKKIKELWESYKSLKLIPNIYVFKESKKSYFLIKDDGYSEHEIRDSLDNFKTQLEGIENRIRIIDLMSLCPLRKEVVKGGKIKVKKEDAEMPCYVCD